MKKLALIIAVLLIPSLASAGCYVWRNGCRYYVRNGCYYKVPYYSYTAPCYNHCAPAAPTKTAGQIAAGLLEKKAEWDFILKAAQTIVGPQQGYGAPAGNPYAQPYAVQRGDTAYASNGGSYTSTYTTVTPQPLDVMAMYNSALKLDEQLNKTSGDANKGTKELLGQALAGMNAALLTQAQMVREQSALKALQPIAPQEIQSQTTYHAEASVNSGSNTNPVPAPNGPAPNGQQDTEPALMAEAPPDGQDFWAPLQGTINNKCVTCHSASQPKGNFNMAGDIRQYDAGMWRKIIGRVNSTNPEIRMPLHADPLSYMEKGWIVAAWGSKADVEGQ